MIDYCCFNDDSGNHVGHIRVFKCAKSVNKCLTSNSSVSTSRPGISTSSPINVGLQSAGIVAVITSAILLEYCLIVYEVFSRRTLGGLCGQMIFVWYFSLCYLFSLLIMSRICEM